MKARILGIKIMGSVAAAAFVATIPLMAQATDAEQAEIASLKRQIYQCHHHKHHRRAACAAQSTVIERTIEKPVVIEKTVEKPIYIEKQVMVDRPVMVEKQTESQAIVEQPVEVMQQRVVVEHSKHRTHLFHIGIPFIGVNLW